jgi:3-dehydroquinate synthase
MTARSAQRVLDVLKTLGFELYANELFYEDAQGSLLVLQGLEEFREHLGGRLTITLLNEIGQGIEVHEIDTRLLLQAMGEIRSFRTCAA